MTINVRDKGYVRATVEQVFASGRFLINCGELFDEDDLIPASLALPAVAPLLADPTFVAGLINLLSGVDWHYEQPEAELSGRTLLAALEGSA